MEKQIIITVNLDGSVNHKAHPGIKADQAVKIFEMLAGSYTKAISKKVTAKGLKEPNKRQEKYIKSLTVKDIF